MGVTDQIARKAARKADEEARNAARKADEKKRYEERRRDEEARRQARNGNTNEKAVDSMASDSDPLFLLAASTGAAAADDSARSDSQSTADENSAWCQREDVSARDCDSWVADQLARKAARKA